MDFPNSALDVLYVGPQEAPSPEPHAQEELDPDLRRRLEKICSRASNFGYETQKASCRFLVCASSEVYGDFTSTTLQFSADVEVSARPSG